MKVALIGAGNLATSLGHALAGAKHEVVQVYSRTEAAARTLARAIGARAFAARPEDVVREADVFILAVTDTALPRVADALLPGRERQFFVHTAGSMAMTAIRAQRRGVLYPMQTFSKQRVVGFGDIPCFVEAEGADDLRLLRTLAETVSGRVHDMDSDRRKYLHVAAVFCCNFANHCAMLGARVLEREGLDFSVMLPLIDETVRKLHSVAPKDAQTGPAARNDADVMRRQLGILEEDYDANMAEVYRTLSNSIRRYTTNNLQDTIL